MAKNLLVFTFILFSFSAVAQQGFRCAATATVPNTTNIKIINETFNNTPMMSTGQYQSHEAFCVGKLSQLQGLYCNSPHVTNQFYVIVYYPYPQDTIGVLAVLNGQPRPFSCTTSAAPRKTGGATTD